MRGTPSTTNKALSAPVLLIGAERSLVIVSGLFWGWAFMGVFPHWPIVIIAACFIANIYLLNFAAKRDSQGVAAFRANSRFLLQNRFYGARGFSAHLEEVKKVKTIPVNILSKF